MDLFVSESFLRRSRAGQGAGPASSRGDNVASHTESVKSYHLGRLVSRVVNHSEKSRRLFDAFYNALKVTINYREAHMVECISRKCASMYTRIYVMCAGACSVCTYVGFT